jgi:hypothetical protein
VAPHAELEDVGGEILAYLFLLGVVANTASNVDPAATTPHVVGHLKSTTFAGRPKEIISFLVGKAWPGWRTLSQEFPGPAFWLVLAGDASQQIC